MPEWQQDPDVQQDILRQLQHLNFQQTEIRRQNERIVEKLDQLLKAIVKAAHSQNERIGQLS